MTVIYLRHKEHGQKVAILDEEAAEDRKNGWEDFDPKEDAEASDIIDTVIGLHKEGKKPGEIGAEVGLPHQKVTKIIKGLT